MTKRMKPGGPGAGLTMPKNGLITLVNIATFWLDNVRQEDTSRDEYLFVLHMRDTTLAVLNGAPVEPEYIQ